MYLATDAGRKLSVVRVRETLEICLLAKKGEPHPVYVRNEDQSVPADASQLRALLEPEKEESNACCGNRISIGTDSESNVRDCGRRYQSPDPE